MLQSRTHNQMLQKQSCATAEWSRVRCETSREPEVAIDCTCEYFMFVLLYQVQASMETILATMPDTLSAHSASLVENEAVSASIRDLISQVRILYLIPGTDETRVHLEVAGHLG